MVVDARVRLADDVAHLDPIDGRRGETGPHAAIDLGGFGVAPDEWMQRAGRRRDDGSCVVHLDDGCLEPEAAHGLAGPLESSFDGLRRAEACAQREVTPELGTDGAELLRPALDWQR